MRKSDLTKQYIAQVFSDLLTKKPYNSISIVDICRAADICRKTFYNNFEDKIDLTIWIVKKDIFDSIPDNQASFWDFYRDMVIYIDKYRQLCFGMLNSREHEILRTFYIKYMASNLEKFVPDSFGRSDSSVKDRSASLELLAVLLIDAINHWILRYPDMPLEDFLRTCSIHTIFEE